jgi:hypothetical protein
MQNIWSIINLLRRNPHWWASVTSFACGVNPDSWMLDTILYVVGKWYTAWWVGPCHHGMARPQFADGGTASNMKGKLRVYWINSREQPTVGGPPAWVLGEVLITPHRKYVFSYETFMRPLCCLPKMALFINYIFLTVAAVINLQQLRKTKKLINKVD